MTSPATTSGWIDRSDRVRIEIGRPDRIRFLQNLTTNDVKKLKPGEGQESFVTTLQGKTLAYISLLATEDSILLRTETPSRQALTTHLTKYGVFDDVSIDDVSAGTFEIHAFGEGIEETLESVGFTRPAEGSLRHVSTQVEGHPILVVRESPTGLPGWSFLGPIEGLDALKSRFGRAGLSEINLETFEALRIEAGTPLSGRDVTLANLPQEVARDSRTINFVKGCYLGQETVARLDALGHVNRVLRRLTIEGTDVVPPEGTPLNFEGKTVGAITSAAFSSRLGQPVALGYVKVAQAVQGTTLGLNIEGVGEFTAIVRELA